MKLFKIGYIVLGIILAAGSVLTGEYGLSKTDREIYQKALSLDDDMQKLGFPQFSLANYRVRFYNGNCDYVVEASQEKIKKEDAVLDVFAGTVVEADGEYQALVPSYENFSSLFDMLDAAGTVSGKMTEGTMAFSKDSYSKNSQAATIWHEAFHIWQQNNWQEEIETLWDNASVQKDQDRGELIVREVDGKPEAVHAFEKEMELLQKAYDAEDTQKKDYILQALDTSGERKKLLSDSANAMEYFLENMEGTAMYVESQAYRRLEDDAAWHEHYLADFQYENGDGKYYHMGMLKALLLDQVTDGWQAEFSMDCSLDELLEKYCRP